MASRKPPPSNPLLQSGGSFSMADSFPTSPSISLGPGVQQRPVLLQGGAEEDSFLGGGSSSMLSQSTLTSSQMFPPQPFLPSSTPSFPTSPFKNIHSSSVNSSFPQSVPLVCSNSPPTSTTPSLPPFSLPPSSVSNPSPGPPLFIPPSSSSVPLSTSKRPVYAALPPSLLTSSPALPPLATPLLPNSPSNTNLQFLPPSTQPTPFLPTTTPQTTNSFFTPSLPHSQSAPSLPALQEKSSLVTAHWFYRCNSGQDIWKPFSVDDSTLIESAWEKGEVEKPVAVEGTRWDVFIDRRVKVPVYWQGDEMVIRRASWFHRSSAEARWIPYEEDLAAKLEAEYVSASSTGQWQCKVVFESGDWVMLHSPEVIMHFPIAAALAGSLDDWGQVQPQVNPALKPRIVHRGLEGLPDIEDGESNDVDHLCFVVHGIGARCDIKLRPIAEVVDDFRTLADDIAGKHFAGARLASQANRVEFLPVNWHDKLHGEDTGTDCRIQPLTLRSIPKLRSFVNDTLLDVLFYTSPLYCQTILDTVCGEINRLHSLFVSRNPNYTGGVSVVGHSLGSLILFDLLSGQTEEKHDEEDDQQIQTPLVKPRWEKDLNIEEVFAKLDISEYCGAFIDQGVGVDELLCCTDDDLKEANLPLGPRKKLLNYLETRKEATEDKDSFQEFQQSIVVNKISYCVGPAGTGTPSVKYPKLQVTPTSFFALGSPIGMFMAVRGIASLGMGFNLPTCSSFYNIFHPYDPVAYRIESLVDSRFNSLRPVVIPHHKGRKRMHLELKETMTRVGGDIKAKVMESLKATMGAVYSVAGTITGQEVGGSVEQQEGHDKDRSVSPTNSEIEDIVAMEGTCLNQGKRVDYVLQEAPMESFNEYVFALASHLCYWESEDTMLLILRELYGSMGVQSDDMLGQNTGYSAIQPPPIPAPEPSIPSFPKSSSYTSFQGSNIAPLMGPPKPSTPYLPPPPPSIGIQPPTPYLPAPSVAIQPPTPSSRGMDPTMPPMERSGPLPPPPTTGFTR